MTDLTLSQAEVNNLLGQLGDITDEPTKSNTKNSKNNENDLINNTFSKKYYNDSSFKTKDLIKGFKIKKRSVVNKKCKICNSKLKKQFLFKEHHPYTKKLYYCSNCELYIN